MKRIALMTLNGNDNYGNKLQHYATQKVLEDYGFKVETVSVKCDPKNIISLRFIAKKTIKIIDNIINRKALRKRLDNFKKFDGLINYSKMYIEENKINNQVSYDYYVVGSDQVWNVTFHTFSGIYLFEGFETKNKIAFSASFGVSYLPFEYEDIFKKNLPEFKAVSVRENQAKTIIEKLIDRNDIEVLVDPTMLLSAQDWDKISNRPKQLDKIKNEKYILNYFLGNKTKEINDEIERFAKENDCHIINILDRKDPFYACGPAEFLYLEKHAFFIFTDSFHSSVFAILYNRPFVVFKRKDGFKDMSSRLDTLISKLGIKNREYNGSRITKENMDYDYTETYEILKKEREKSKKFLNKALDI